ncbi:uncharacterized protein TM35_000071440 [Trypanosoma theileri]|uniref:Ras-GAP domain-containing protein n=1 Tax=Trypanosoma theileri TaxID=67003 RepID=A0A1X0P2V4_9TRYP|nr:uncharacterized protein TM35_000071440 [Trypanosoma theileri]ORC90720.1 hypothetical protein TM35_000071440 [Trypanosoma theileri]
MNKDNNKKAEQGRAALTLQSTLHDNMGVSQNTSFIRVAQSMWTSYRLSVISTGEIYNKEFQLLPIHIQTVHYSNIIFKQPESLQAEIVVITDVCLFIVNEKKMKRIRLMIPLVLIVYVKEMIETCKNGTTQHSQVIIANRSKNSGKNLECYFFMNCFNAETFIGILKRVYEISTIHLLPVVRNPSDTTERDYPLSMYHQRLRSEKEVRCRTLLTVLKYKTMSFISTLSNVSLMMPENNCQWDFIALMLFSVCRRVGVLRELLKSCLKYEIIRAKSPLRNHNATSICFQQTGGFLRSNSLANKVISIYTYSSASQYAVIVLGNTVKILLDAIKCDLFKPEDTASWSLYVFAKVLQKPHDPFPNEARTLTNLILEIETEDGGNEKSKDFIGDMFFLQFVARVLKDPGRLGVSVEGSLVTQRKNLDRIIRVTECLFNGTRKSFGVSHFFSPSLSGDNDEDAINLMLNSEEIKSFFSRNAAGASSCIDELITASKKSPSSVYAELSDWVEEKDNTAMNVERELEALNDAIGKYAIHLFADRERDLWDILMESEEQEASPMPLKVLNISGEQRITGDANHTEIEQLRVDNAKLHIQLQQLREKAERSEKRELEAINALLQSQKRLDEQNHEMQLLHLRATKGYYIIPPLPHREESEDELSLHLPPDHSNFSTVSKTHALW